MRRILARQAMKFIAQRGRSRMAALAALLVLAMGAAGCGGPEPLMLGGTVEAESSDIVTEVAGRITGLTVLEGQSVTRGAVLAQIDDTVQRLAVTQLEAVVTAKEARLAELKAGTRTEQVEQARQMAEAARAQYEQVKKGATAEQIRTADAQVAIAQTAVEAATVLADYAASAAGDADALHARGELSDAAWKDARYKRDAAQVSLRTAQDQLAAAKAQRAQVKSGAGSDAVAAAKAQYDAALAQLALAENGAAGTTLDMAEADLAQSRAALAQGKAVLEKYRLKAPRDGVVTLVSINEGEVVNPGAAIGTVSDLSDLSVRLYIPQKHLTAIALGQTLALSATAIADRTVEGELDWISDVAEFTPRNTETTASKESTVFRFTVRVHGADTGLKPGMAVEAVIPGAYMEP